MHRGIDWIRYWFRTVHCMQISVVRKEVALTARGGKIPNKLSEADIQKRIVLTQ